MFPKKQQVPPNLRLPKLPSTPGFEDFSYVLTQAQKARGRTVEVAWTSSDRLSTYMLSVRVEPSGGEPFWALYKGDAPGSPMVLSHVSGDISLIFNLVMDECAHVHAQDALAQTGSFAALTPPGAAGADSGGFPAAVTRPLATSGGHPAIAPKTKATLEGDLKNMQAPSLLQSINISKMTGRLIVEGTAGAADVFFVEGAPIHATALDNSGDLALLELLTWEEGEFAFYPEEKTEYNTVTKRLDALLMEAVALIDQTKYLSKSGVTMDSYLLRKHPKLTEAEFEMRVCRGAPIELSTQKAFYQAIDNKSTLFEVLRKLPMTKTDWVPVMFNMLSCDLVTATDKSPVVAKPAPLEAMGVDKAAIQGVIKNLSRPETGLFTYPALLYLMEQEYFRFEAFGTPFAVCIFEVRTRSEKPGAPPDPLPIPAVRDMARRINTVKRNFDILGHYETFDYALLLPNTTAAAAAVCANRIVEICLRGQLADIDPRGVLVAIGVASVPEDCRELGMVLAAALEAKKQAKATGAHVMLFRDVRARQVPR